MLLRQNPRNLSLVPPNKYGKTITQFDLFRGFNGISPSGCGGCSGCNGIGKCSKGLGDTISDNSGQQILGAYLPVQDSPLNSLNLDPTLSNASNTGLSVDQINAMYPLQSPTMTSITSWLSNNAGLLMLAAGGFLLLKIYMPHSR
jgi:hypothetical protein